ncbi:hypothetical protein [Sphingomonas sp. LR55]|uniref:hypothetical protein n=1 Tax=Sphingomonas sp. LR55 TaxID=3050231 RepID=UPI002FE3B580
MKLACILCEPREVDRGKATAARVILELADPQQRRDDPEQRVDLGQRGIADRLELRTRVFLAQPAFDARAGG